jgi:hypothetical protein
MTRGIGALFLGAAVMSLLVPCPRSSLRRLSCDQGSENKEPCKFEVDSGAEAASAPALRLLALVQVRPTCQVLAISESREELELEMLELNETWNHWQLRTERQRYEIQVAPVLRRIAPPAVRRPRVASA